LRNRNDASADTELIRVVNSMRRQSETLDERTARTAYVAYVSRYGPRARTPDAGDIGIPASDLLATFAWLTRMPGVSDRAEINDQVVATLKK
jgi:hypothetical protein